MNNCTYGNMKANTKSPTHPQPDIMMIPTGICTLSRFFKRNKETARRPRNETHGHWSDSTGFCFLILHQVYFNTIIFCPRIYTLKIMSPIVCNKFLNPKSFMSSPLSCFFPQIWFYVWGFFFRNPNHFKTF